MAVEVRIPGVPEHEHSEREGEDLAVSFVQSDDDTDDDQERHVSIHGGALRLFLLNTGGISR